MPFSFPLLKCYNKKACNVIACLFSAEKLSDFLLGLTDVSPTDRTPASLSDTDYMVCAQYVGTVPAGQTVHIQCSTLNTSGRYMFLLRRGPNRYLQLCEMEVYAWKGGFSSYKLNSVVRDGSVRMEGWVLFIQTKLSCVRWKCTN